MDDEVLQRVFQGGGREYFSQQPGSTSSSILQSLPLHVTFDHGYYLLVKAIQELREKKGGLVTVGIGGPIGSGKTSLAEKVASVLGSVVVSMENYRDGVDDNNELDLIDFDTLVKNLEDLVKGKDTFMPVFDFKEKKRVGSKIIKCSSSGVVIVDGTYALHSKLRSCLDIRVAVVGGVHFSLLSKVRYDIGDTCSLDYLIDSIFPLFRKNIEPDLHHAQIRINNSFVSSFREPYYKLKCRREHIALRGKAFGEGLVSALSSFNPHIFCSQQSPVGLAAYSFDGSETQTENTKYHIADSSLLALFYVFPSFIEMYLRPPSASEEARISDWIKVRQSGIRYYLSLGDQRIVDKNYIIRPKAEFEVGRMTLGGLLALGYVVVVSYKRTSTSIIRNQMSLSFEYIDTLDETFMVLKGTDRKAIGQEASRLCIKGPWITKSYLEMILESKGVPRLNTPPPLSSASTRVEERVITAPKPIHVASNVLSKLDDLAQPWTRSPRKSEMDPVLAKWHFIPSSSLDDNSVKGFYHEAATDSSFTRESIQLAPMPDSYDLDRGLLLSVQAIQALLENKGLPVIVGIGGPSGSGKTSLAHKMANIVGCEVISLESYYKSDQVKDFKYDNFSSLDLSLLSKNIDDLRNCRKTRVPFFDFENCTRSGFRDLQVSEDCGVVIFEGVYALHPEIRKSLDLWVAVVGGVHSHLISRVQRDKSRAGCSISQNEIMTTVFPMFPQHIEPHLVHAHGNSEPTPFLWSRVKLFWVWLKQPPCKGKGKAGYLDAPRRSPKCAGALCMGLALFFLSWVWLKIWNDFDPVLSPESSLFVLKSNKQVANQDIMKVLDPGKVCSSVQNFTDIYLKLPGTPIAKLAESDCIRVRICEGRFALLIREPIREGNFILQPKVDFDISVSTVAGLLNLGYQVVAYIEGSALIYQDGKILIEVDHLQDAPSPYLQIKGANKEIVAVAGSALNLDGSYTTKIILENTPAFQKSTAIHGQQATRLQELVEFIQSQGGSSGSESSRSRDALPMESIIEDLQLRIRRLERWHTINTAVAFVIFSSALTFLFRRQMRGPHSNRNDPRIYFYLSSRELVKSICRVPGGRDPWLGSTTSVIGGRSSSGKEKPRQKKQRFGNMAGIFAVMAFAVRALDGKDIDTPLMSKLTKIATAEMITSKVNSYLSAMPQQWLIAREL
ncbi:hypothetical protein ACLOJK_025260 [Asimina triloba]